MTVFASRSGQAFCSSLLVAAALSLVSPAAQANPIINYNFSVTGDSSPGVQDNFAFAQAGVATADPQRFSHMGSLVDPVHNDWAINWNSTSDPDPSVGSALLISGLTIENNMADLGPGTNHLQFVLQLTLPVYASNLPATVVGNAGMTLNITPGSPGILTTVGNNSIWNAQINGATVGSLYNPGFVLGGSSGPATASTNPGQQIAPFNFNNPINTIGIRIVFDLTPGETVTFNDTFQFIPTPGALALLGLAGLAGGRRRRV